MQAAILCGGLATRLGSLTKDVPKSMLDVGGKPFLQHQLELLAKHGICDVVLCVGHFHEQIMEYFGDGARLGLNIEYSIDGDTLLGTGGALRKALPLLDEDFFVLYGDSYLILPYEHVWNVFKQSEQQGLMVVYKNRNKYDRSNVAICGNEVVYYDVNHESSNLEYIDEGLSVLKRTVLRYLPEDAPAGLGALFAEMAKRRQLACYETRQRFYEIGSVSGFRELKRIIKREKK